MSIIVVSFQFYTANVSPTTGTEFTVTNMDWFSGLQAGQTLELNYEMTFEGDVQPLITAISLNGEDSCSGSATTTTGPQTTTSEPQTTTSGPQTTTSVPQTTTKIQTTQQSTVSSTTPPITTTTSAPSTTSPTKEPSTTTTSSSSACDVEITNSWTNNIQGKIRLTVPSDISDFSIVLNTDLALTGIQVILLISDEQ